MSSWFLRFCLLWSVSALGEYIPAGANAPMVAGLTFDGKELSLIDYRGTIVVLEWTNHRSPYVQKQYAAGSCDNLSALQKACRQMEVPVTWLMIDSTPSYSDTYLSSEGWKAELEQWGASPTSLLLDESGEIASAFGVQRVPEVIVIDRQGVIVYRGAIDSLRGTDPQELGSPDNIHWLHRAIEQACRGREVVPAETIPYGSSVR